MLRKILLPLRSDFHANDTLKSFNNDYLKAVAEQQANLVNGRPVQLLEAAVPEAKKFLEGLVGSQFFADHPELLYVKTVSTVGLARPERVSSSVSGRSPASQQSALKGKPSGPLID